MAIFITITIGILGCNKTTKTENNPEENNPTEIKQEEDPSNKYPRPLAGSCDVSSFFEGLSKYYLNDSNVYIVKGIVLDKIEYGLNVKFVEDLKGNFPENVNTFIAWGAGTPHNSFLNRIDDFGIYDSQDVLIMLLTPSLFTAEMVPPNSDWFEKPEDYCTLSCTHSVLKLSDGNVTGYMFSQKKLDDRELSEEQRMPQDLFEETANTPRIENATLTANDKAILDQHLSKYAAFTIDGKEMAGYFSGGSGCIRLQIDEDFNWTIRLELNDLRAPDYKATYTTSEGEFEVTEPFVINTFKGETSAGQYVRFSIDENTFNGIIFGEDYTYTIRPTKDYTQNREDKSFIVYKSWDVIFYTAVMETIPYDDFQKKLNDLLLIK